VRRRVPRYLSQSAALLALLPAASGFCITGPNSSPQQMPGAYRGQACVLHAPWQAASRRMAESVRRDAARDTWDGDSDRAWMGCRRDAIVAAAGMLAALSLPASSSSEEVGQASKRGRGVARETLVQVADPSSYSALAYAPPGAKRKLPLIVVLHGAGKNELDAWSLADPTGEHAGLAPSLLATGRAPPELANNFALVAPYSAGKRSFYEEPRKRVLQFVDWVCSEQGRAAGCPLVDPDRVFLFGFSDGATVGIELMTSGRFKGGVFAAYGFTGQLPELALKRLKDVPIWIFHSADDVIFPV